MVAHIVGGGRGLVGPLERDPHKRVQQHGLELAGVLGPHTFVAQLAALEVLRRASAQGVLSAAAASSESGSGSLHRTTVGLPRSGSGTSIVSKSRGITVGAKTARASSRRRRTG